MRKRYKIKNKFRFSIFLLVLGLVISLAIYTSAMAKESPSYRYLKIKDGDTLWAIAENNYDCKEKDIRQYIYEIRQVNNMETAELSVKDYIKLPY